MRFALLEAKIAIVKTLHTFEIQTCEKTQVSQDISSSMLPLVFLDSSRIE